MRRPACTPLPLRAFGRLARGHVGLLGGSFNPAHAGHRHLSELALKRLGLDEVWWLVSPQNPLKPEAGMAKLAERLGSAAALCRHPRMSARDVEARMGTRYSADTLALLKRRFPRVRFVWLMGADNLIQIPRWEQWGEIFRTLPVAVFARPPYSLRALSGIAAHRFAGWRWREQSARRLARAKPPAWVFLHTRLERTSATSIRQMRAANAVPAAA